MKLTATQAYVALDKRISALERAASRRYPVEEVAEPRGLGAVVEDGAHGFWVRCGFDRSIPLWQQMRPSGSIRCRSWSDLEPPITVLHVGWLP